MLQENDIPGPGKFEGNKSLAISKYLYSIVQDGTQDEQFGSVEDSLWEALIDADEVGYIVTEDNLGFFSYTEYPTVEEARSKYMADLAAYESHK